MTYPEPIEPNVEGWLGQIWLDERWQDYARGYEVETKRWQRAEPTKRRIVHWIDKEVVLVDATTPKVKLWAVNATVEPQTRHGWSSTITVPTFYLHPEVQGITDAAHASIVATEILKAAGPAAATHVHVEPIYEESA